MGAFNGSSNNSPRYWDAYTYVQESLKMMFKEQAQLEINEQHSKRKHPSLAEYFQLGVEHCLKLAKSGNSEAQKKLPEIFFKLAQYHEDGDKTYGISKNPERANEFLNMAIRAEMINEKAEML